MPKRVFNAVRRLASRAGRYAQRRKFPLTQEDILAAFRQFGDFRSPALMVHSSLSACGQIRGGAPTVIAALREWIGPATLAMPVHTYSYPESRNPEFSLQSSPSKSGAISECFRRLDGVIRSFHPSHSVACLGPLKEVICRGHEDCGSPCGRGSPYARLIEHDVAVLLFGVDFDCYTLFHTAEAESTVPYYLTGPPYPFTILEKSGKTRTEIFRRHNMALTRRFKEMESWFEERGLIARQRLGRGRLTYIPSAARAHQDLVAELKVNPYLFLTEEGKNRFLNSPAALTP